jgi:hypothetical protein
MLENFILTHDYTHKYTTHTHTESEPQTFLNDRHYGNEIFFYSFSFWFATFFDTPIYHFFDIFHSSNGIGFEKCDRKQQQ